MPSPGQSTIATEIGGVSFTLEVRGTTLNFNSAGAFIQKLATAVDAGWTSAHPVTITTMASTFTSEFSGYFAGSAQGKDFINAIASAIDYDVTLWALSYDLIEDVHSYEPTASSLKAKILSNYPAPSSGVDALLTQIATTFANYFEKEGE